jgi:peroxiredoxin Q/BCP
VKLAFLFSRPEPLKAGDPVPQISAVDQDGSPVDFGRIGAQGLALVYFFPKADTPGCTAQGCSLRDAFEGLSRDGLSILGVSGDRPEAQKRFREKFRLPYPLVADFDGRVAEAFGVPVFLGMPARRSFLIRDSRIVWTTRRAKTAEHAEEVRQAISKLF